MSNDAADFTLRLIDKVSGSSMKITGSVNQLNKALASVGAQSKGATGALGRMTGGLGATEKAADKAGSSVMSFIGGNLIAGAIERAAGAMLHLGEAVLETGAHLVMFGQNSRFAFDQLAKHGATGEQLFEHARALAVRFGLDVEDTTHSYANLLKLQFSPKQADDLVRMTGDLRALGSTAEDTKGILLALGQIKGKGRLMGQEMLQLAERGVSQELIQEEIGKALGGKTNQEVQKLQEAGKVSADVGLEAIKSAIKRKLQEANLGDAGAKFADTTIEGIKGRFLALSEDTGLDIVKKLTTPITKLLSGGLTRFENFLDSPQGADTVNKIADGIEKAANFAMMLADAFGGGFADTLGALYDGAKPFFALFAGGDGQMATEVLKSIATHLGEAAALAVGFGVAFSMAAAGVVFLGDAILTGAGAALDWFGEKIFGVMDGLANLDAKMRAWGAGVRQSFLDIGSSIVNGLVDGITALATAPVEAIKRVVGGIITAARGVLESHSPSREMYAVGETAPQGLALASDDGRKMVADAGARMADSYVGGAEMALRQPAWTAWDMPTAGSGDAFSAYGPATSAAAPRDAVGMGARVSGGGMDVRFGDIKVTVESAPGVGGEELGRQIGVGVRRELDDYFRELELET